VAWWGACVGFGKAVGMPKRILWKKCHGWYFIVGMKWVHVPWAQSATAMQIENERHGNHSRAQSRGEVQRFSFGGHSEKSSVITKRVECQS
jgi:hypothetical protein